MALGRNVLANFAGQGAVALMALVFTPVYVHRLGIEGYGLVGVYTLLYALLGFVDGSLQTVFTRTIAQARDRRHDAVAPADLLRSFEWLVLGAAAAFAGLCALAAPLVATHWLQATRLETATVTHALQLIGLLVGLRLLEGLYRAGLMGLERQVAFNAIHASASVLRWGGAAVVVTWVEASVIAFFLWQVAASLCAIALLGACARRACGEPGRLRRAAFAGLRRFAAGSVAIGLTAILLTQTTPLLLSHLLPLDAFGVYALAAMAASALMLLAMPVADAFYPRLCARQGSGDAAAFAHTFHLGAQTLAAIVAGAALAGIVHAQPLLELWTRDAALAAEAAPLTQLLLAGGLLNALMWMPYRAQLAHGWTGLTVRINTAAVLVLVPATLVVVPFHGAIGAAALWIALNAGYLLIGVHWMYRRILVGEKWRWYRDGVLAPVGAAVAVALLLELALPDPVGPAQHLIAALATGGLALLAAAGAAPEVRWAIVNRLAIARTG
jgi:O-antigen/teichoic acid export membrane protein